MSKQHQFITILFSCDVCGIKDVPCRVRAREKEEDVKYYLEQVISRAVAFEHQLKSFTCQATSLKDLKIPLPPNDDPDPWIGKYNSVSSFKSAHDSSESGT